MSKDIRPSATRIVGRLKSVSTLLLAVLLSLAAGQIARAQSNSALDEAYNESVRDAAVYQHSHVLKLKPLPPPTNGKVSMVTLTSYTGYKIGPTTLGVDVWTTIVPEVQERCIKFPSSSLTLDLQKLLGFPPNKSFTNFVVFLVDPSDIFRPSPDPATNTEYPCSDASDPECGNAFPSGVTDAHRAWIATQSLSSYQIPGGYPWTHLGYTYYWGHGKDIYGASEYVIRKGSSVQVVSVTSYEQYCSPEKTEH